ncbi:protein-L-isoaspartate(D-aspartate) O-methyltransferase [methanotrophic endosymbiont of Bathymodiolus puteoserpentis (Logatchev)]|jgi:protein-L-isoaspartate(D-aspartate) O-methyltransferase|uniref:protein-L-isoaspartate(D-aspartate) O-methyltransferase n=1 Tax=methanotrophic endosymbiont of Bathymodiolus puteoserpentis (Logatchev) TaxID=343235 RepID=UPI0013C69765|nr:protein-L-isoaspartate(D-aspartate) O-methyltransferase [methanotrophic endosymbiont of Bathymodiolus puteoserpentis (Logatchev)]SHE23107.1 Protein-L-isoaspartate O-methyltransferase [methanotrophic endosymbiont of Bathymodiolus puteoserpentis (Logatchev)]
MKALLQTEGIGMTSRRTRERMIDRLVEQGISSHKILDAMRNVPRHLFMDDALASRAYEDTALPIGYGQTISQPYIVAKMTELLLDHRHMKNVLEIGTGCGYQTAVLAQLVDHVYSVERIEPLYKQAKNRLWDLQVRNVSYLHSDGGWGWPEKAPYDGILVAAAPPEIPQALLDQMAVGGIMLIPIGKERGVQELQRVIRTRTGYEIESLEPVSFVPFLSGKK